LGVAKPIPATTAPKGTVFIEDRISVSLEVDYEDLWKHLADRDCDGHHLGTVAWLAFTGYGANKSYYVTIAELGGMGDKAYHSQLRVEGFVVPGSIEHNGPT
jgi:hypothetical protein